MKEVRDMAKRGRPEKHTDDELLAWVVKHYQDRGEVMYTSYNIEPKKSGGPTFTTIAKRLGPQYGSIQNMLLAQGVEPTRPLCSWSVPDQSFLLEPALTIHDASFTESSSAPEKSFKALQPYEGNLHWRRPADQSARFLVMDDDEDWIVLGLLDPLVEYVRGNSTSRIWRVTGTVEYPPYTVHPSIPVDSTAIVLACYNRDNECLWGRLAVTES